MSVRMRQEVEKKIATAFIESALSAGLFINIDNGGDDLELPKQTNDKALILKTMFAADEDRVYVYKNETDKKAIGWVYFVYGNDGWDVISDYTVNLGEEKLNLMVEADRLSTYYSDNRSADLPVTPQFAVVVSEKSDHRQTYDAPDLYGPLSKFDADALAVKLKAKFPEFDVEVQPLKSDTD
jgi:hypothetical protein